MAAELGKAYVQIIPSAQGISTKLKDTLKDPIDQTGKGAGKSLATSIGHGLTSIGGAMTKYITKPAMVAVGALGGATLFAGWKRMTEIDNAKVKLEAIGNSAQSVEKITSNALAAVKGTAYGLNDAMTTSASAVAAGIKPGQELEGYLKAISDASAVAGTDMSAMGNIFNKVATQGKAHNDVLQQMSEAGIPIYQYLSDQLGVTAGEVFELASAGEIGLADFQAAVSSHIGGAAQEIGSKTITGAISNLKASLSRIGANFLGSADDADSFAGKLLPILNNMMGGLEGVEAKAKEWGAAFGTAFGNFATAISQIPLPVLGSLAGALVGLGPALSFVGKALPIISTVLSALPASISAVIAPVAAVVGVLALAYARSESFRNAVNGLVMQVAGALKPAFQAIVPFIKLVITEVMNVASAIGNALAPVIKLVTPVIVFLAKVFVTKFKVAVQVAGAVIRTISAVIQAAAAIIQGVATGLNNILSTAWNYIKRNAGKAWSAIKNAITAPFRAVAGVVRSIVGAIKSAISFSSILNSVKNTFHKVYDFITSPFKKAKDMVKKAIDGIKGLFPLNVGKILSGIKLPKFSVSGGKAPWGFGGMGKMPSVSVKWNRQAEQQPYMFRSATLFGAGEHNDEVLYGRAALMRDIKSATGGGQTTINLYTTVNGAENAEEWAANAVAAVQRKMRVING